MSLSDRLVSAERDTEHQVKSLRHLTERVAKAEGESFRRIEREISETGRSFVSALRQEAAKTRLLLYLGFKALIERLDEQTEILEEMLQVLREPERTKAREKQRDGARAYANGTQTHNPRWFQDAIRDFSQAIETDRYDFISYWYLGLICAFEFMDDLQSEMAFRESAHYSWPDNPTASACALVGLGLVFHANGRTQEAEEAAAEAVKRDPKLAIAYYHLAIYCTANGRLPTALDRLRRAILLDPELFNAAAVDPLLQACPGVDGLLNRLLEEARSELMERYLRVYEQWIDEAEEVLRRWQPEGLSQLAKERQEAQRIAREIALGEYVRLVGTEIREEASHGVHMVKSFVAKRLGEVVEKRRKAADEDPAFILIVGGLAAVVIGAVIGAIIGAIALGVGIAILEDWYTETQPRPGYTTDTTVFHAPIGPIFGYAIAATIGLGLAIVLLMAIGTELEKVKAQRDCKALTPELERWQSLSYLGQELPATLELEPQEDIAEEDIYELPPEEELGPEEEVEEEEL